LTVKFSSCDKGSRSAQVRHFISSLLQLNFPSFCSMHRVAFAWDGSVLSRWNPRSHFFSLQIFLLHSTIPFSTLTSPMCLIHGFFFYWITEISFLCQKLA
jgi:hypothetical protein